MLQPQASAFHFPLDTPLVGRGPRGTLNKRVDTAGPVILPLGAPGRLTNECVTSLSLPHSPSLPACPGAFPLQPPLNFSFLKRNNFLKLRELIHEILWNKNSWPWPWLNQSTNTPEPSRFKVFFVPITNHRFCWILPVILGSSCLPPGPSALLLSHP